VKKRQRQEEDDQITLAKSAKFLCLQLIIEWRKNLEKLATWMQIKFEDY